MKKEKIICTFKQAEEMLDKNKIYILWYFSKAITICTLRSVV